MNYAHKPKFYCICLICIFFYSFTFNLSIFLWFYLVSSACYIYWDYLYFWTCFYNLTLCYLFCILHLYLWYLFCILQILMVFAFCNYSKTLVCEHNSFQKHACNPKHLYIKVNFPIRNNGGDPGWFSRLSIWLRLRSWSRSSWVPAPIRALYWQLRAWSLLRILCLPLSLPFSHSSVSQK